MASAEHEHLHPMPETRPDGRRALVRTLALTLAFSGVEAVSGWWAGSLALLSDAGHMLSDSLSLGLALLAAWIARQPPSARHSYGLVRAEVVAALVNALALLAVIVAIAVEAVERLRAPQPVAGGVVMGVAFLGLLINLAAALMLSQEGKGINVRGALLHVLGDLLGSVAALVAGAVIYFTGWTPIDPILSVVVALLILASTVRLLREALHIFMEGVPAHLELESVGREMAKVEGVRGVHDLHIWTLSSGTVALSAHLELADLTAWPAILERTQALLRDRFGIDHATLQPEILPWIEQPYQAWIPIYPEKAAALHRKAHKGRKGLG